jgi:CubicO group peptidase (beta-lactamase class C family)
MRKTVLVLSLLALRRANVMGQTTERLVMPLGAQTRIEARIDSILAPWARKNGPGIAALVVYQGTELYAKGFGLSSLESNTPIDRSTVFDLGSLSKQFTATATLLLVRDGKLGLDERVSEIYPEFAKEWAGITIRMLLNHTAGLPDFIALFRARGAESNDFPRHKRGTTHVAEPDENDVLNLIASAPLQFPPGSSWAYCNSCYALLADVVERISKESFAAFVAANVLAPAGMSKSWVNTREIPSGPGLAHSYFPVEQGWEERDYTPLDSAVHGAGGLYSSISDLEKWYAAMDTAFLLPAPLAALERRSGTTSDGRLTHYGMGWVVDSSLGVARIEHGGWWKGFRHVVLRYPDERLTVVLLSNDASFAPLRAETAFRISRLFLVDRLSFPSAVKIPTGVLDKYVGDYRVDSETTYTVRLRDGSLWVNTGHALLRLQPVATARFVVAGIEEEKFEFKRDGSGLRLVRSEPGLGGTTTTVTASTRVNLTEHK